jgi:hypothetical protein
MILKNKITIEELSINQKDHKWEKQFCNKCNRYMWGHGFTKRCFSMFSGVVYLKRHRCPCCSVVLTIRPVGFWSFFQSSIQIIYETLKWRLNAGAWPYSFLRQRGGHWLRRFTNYAQMENQTNLLSFLEFCFTKNISFLI